VSRNTNCRYSTTEPWAVRRRYEDLRRRNGAYEEIVELLRDAPDIDAVGILRRIRQGGDVQEILDHVKAEDLLLQLALAPESRRRRYEFPYVSSKPPRLLSTDNIYLKSLLYEVTFNPNSTYSTQLQSPYLKPYHAVQIAEPLLSEVLCSRWTSVISDDKLFRRLLGSFFLHCYAEWHPFHKDLFLEDMAVRKNRFCSSLLVNSVLATTCVGYRL